MLKLGLDIGSTTIKCVVLDEENKIIYSTYERHYSQITEKIAEILATVRSKVKGVENAAVALSGSAGMGVAESSNIAIGYLRLMGTSSFRNSSFGACNEIARHASVYWLKRSS